MNPSLNSISWLRSACRELVDFAFPPQCPLCGAVDFRVDEFRVAYCPACIDELCPKPRNRCLCCSAEVGPFASTENGCTHCRNRTLRFDSVVCLGMYEDALKRAVLSAKWSFSAVRMKSLGVLLARHHLSEFRELGIDRVIPIPQYWRQRAIRHFNPAWMISAEIAAQLNVSCDVHILRRARRTRPQKRVAVSQRFDNQTGAFGLKDVHVIKGERLLIVDDVLTTGATCSEAAKILKRSGAKSCHVAVLARVLDHSG